MTTVNFFSNFSIFCSEIYLFINFTYIENGRFFNQMLQNTEMKYLKALIIKVK